MNEITYVRNVREAAQPTMQTTFKKNKSKIRGGRSCVGWGKGQNQIILLSKAIFLHMPFVNDKMLIKMNFCLILLLYLTWEKNITYQRKYTYE